LRKSKAPIPKALQISVLGLLLWASVADAAQLHLSWTDNSTNEDTFEVQRKLGTSGTYAKIGEVTANTTTYVDSTVADATLYCYRVRAVNAAGASAWSNEACTTTPAPVPAPPSNLKVTQ